MSSTDPTEIFAEWDPNEPTIIVRIQGKPLPEREWQAWTDAFQDVPPPNAKGQKTGDKRVMVIKFREKPPLEFVESCFFKIKQHIEFKGFPDNEELWNVRAVIGEPLRFADPENVKMLKVSDEIGITPKGLHDMVCGVEEVIRVKNGLIGEVGTGAMSFQQAYCDLIEAITAELEVESQR